MVGPVKASVEVGGFFVDEPEAPEWKKAPLLVPSARTNGGNLRADAARLAANAFDDFDRPAF